VSPLSAAAAVRLVTAREVRQRLRSRSFRVGTALVALLAAGLALLPAVVPAAGEHRWTLAVVGTAPASLQPSVDAVAAANSARITVRRDLGGDAADIVRRDDVDAALVDGHRVLVDAGGGSDLRRAMTAAVVRARLAGLVGDPAALKAARQVQVERVGEAHDSAAESVVRFAGVLVLFYAIATYGSWVLTSVLEEKANRVVEIVVSTIRPRHLLAGKVIGNGLAGLLQLSVMAAGALLAGQATGAFSDVPAGGLGTILATIGWFGLGFGFYAVGYAAAGALVSRQEDAQSAMTPMLMIAMTAYLLSVLVVNPEPGAVAATIISLLPPAAPMAMPVRIAAGEAPIWQVAVSVALMLGTTWLMVRVAGRVYAAGLLRTGARVPLRRALRGAGSP
jgi:ABC-2 type transport system permease protein